MFNSKKSLGQNFLVDKNIIKKIVSITKISNKDFKKAVSKSPHKHLKTRIETLIKENEEAIKVINENIY